MKIRPLRVGNVTIRFPVGLAPMAAFTDSAMRSLHLEFECGVVFTEVVNAAALVHRSKRTFHMLDTLPGERPIAAHMYGGEPEILARAAVAVQELGRFDFIDINCGCPVRKIVAKGAGAALMKEPARLEAIVRAVSRAVSLPVTVKTRTGFSEGTGSVFDVAAAAEAGGAAALSVHARLAISHHRGDADWRTLAELKRKSTIPVLGNGGINGPHDVQRMLEQTGVDGVLIGRAAIGNPWIFREARRLLERDTQPPHSPAEHCEVIREHLRRLHEQKCREAQWRRRSLLPPEQAAAVHFRGHLFRYLSGLPGWSDVRRRLNDMRSLDDIMEAAESVLAPLESEMTPRPAD